MGNPDLAAVRLTLKLATVVTALPIVGTPLLARITKRSAERLAIRPGLALHAQIKSVALVG